MSRYAPKFESFSRRLEEFRIYIVLSEKTNEGFEHFGSFFAGICE